MLMGSLTKIAFMGCKVNDMILYFSRIFIHLGKKVAVVDASLEQLLKYSVPEAGEGNLITYRNVDVFLDCDNMEKLSKLNTNGYDIVMINFGLNDELIKEVSDCSIRFAVTDLERHNILKLKDFLSRADTNLDIIRIYRDVVDSKISKKYLDSILESFRIKYIADYEFYLDDVEYTTRIESQHNDIFKFNKLPKEYKAMFQEVIIEYLSVDKKQLVSAIKMAERGR